MNDPHRLSKEQLEKKIREIVEKIELLPETHQAAFEALIQQHIEAEIAGTAGPVDIEKMRQEFDALVALHESVDEDERDTPS